jgi:hypothetical protein
VPEAAERRSSLPPPPEGLEDDFVSLDLPVRELPDHLADIERRARERAKPRSASPTDLGDEEAGDRRRRQVRRWSVLVLAATAGIFLYLERSGIEPGAFSDYAPMFAFAILLMVCGTFQPVPPHVRKNPVAYAFLGMVAFWILAGLALQFKDLVPERAGLFQAVYMGLGGICLLVAVWASRKPLNLAAAAEPVSPATAAGAPRQPIGADPYGSRLRVLAACRSALEQIARHAPERAQARGWLDLAGPEVPHKLVDENRKGKLYEDNWWRLRLPWEDGVRLRVIGTERSLVRTDGEREPAWTLQAKLSVNRRRWRTEQGPFRPPVSSGEAGSGGLQVEDFQVTPSQVSARIVAERWAFEPDDLVALIRILEERVQPLGAAGGEA